MDNGLRKLIINIFSSVVILTSMLFTLDFCFTWIKIRGYAKLVTGPAREFGILLHVLFVLLGVCIILLYLGHLDDYLGLLVSIYICLCSLICIFALCHLTPSQVKESKRREVPAESPKEHNQGPTPSTNDLSAAPEADRSEVDVSKREDNVKCDNTHLMKQEATKNYKKDDGPVGEECEKSLRERTTDVANPVYQPRTQLLFLQNKILKDTKVFRKVYKMILDQTENLLEKGNLLIPDTVIQKTESGDNSATGDNGNEKITIENGAVIPSVSRVSTIDNLRMLVRSRYRKLYITYCANIGQPIELYETQGDVSGIKISVLKTFFRRGAATKVEDVDEYLWLRYLFLRCEEGIAYMGRTCEYDYMEEYVEMGLTVEVARSKKLTEIIEYKWCVGIKRLYHDFLSIRARLENDIQRLERSELYELLGTQTYLKMVYRVFVDTKSFYEELFEDGGQPINFEYLSKSKCKEGIRCIFLLNTIASEYAKILRLMCESSELGSMLTSLRIDFHHGIILGICAVINSHLIEIKNNNSSFKMFLNAMERRYFTKGTSEPQKKLETNSPDLKVIFGTLRDIISINIPILNFTERCRLPDKPIIREMELKKYMNDPDLAESSLICFSEIMRKITPDTLI